MITPNRSYFVRLLLALCLACGAVVLPRCTLLTSFEECESEQDCAPISGGACVEGICEQAPSLPRREVAGVIGADTLWTADTIWVLKDTVTVSPSVVLTIEPGTQILGERNAALVVRSGGRLEARGTRAEPIVFTSARQVGQRKSGDWGGLAMLGRASVNRENPSLNILTDQEEAQFGGSDDAWSCGTLEYVRVEFAGGQVAGEEALNGVTLAGCGSGTSLNYLQIHYGADDGLELFGGTVDVRYVLITRPQDDGLDIDLGWRGTGQFIAVQMDAGGDNAVEIDNLREDPLATPRTDFTIYNYTLVGDRALGQSRGITFKDGGYGTFSHGIIASHRKEAIDVFGAETGLRAQEGKMRVARTLFFDIGPEVMQNQPPIYFPVAGQPGEVDPETMTGDDDSGLDELAFFSAPELQNSFGANPGLEAAGVFVDPNFTPSVAVSANQPAPPAPPFDPTGVYLGAFSPSAVPWTDGWVAYPGS